MSNTDKTVLIRKAYEDFANKHKGEILKACEIYRGVQAMLDFKINNQMRPHDFEKNETSHTERSRLNKTLFKRERHGIYLILGSND